MGIARVTHFSGETNLRIDFDDIRQAFHFLAGVFVERAQFLRGRRLWRRGGGEIAEGGTRGNEQGIKQTGIRQALRGQLLQADAKRKHGDQRGHADGDSQRGQRVAQDGLAQIAESEFAEVAGFHDFTPSLTNLPSATEAMRSANLSARRCSCVTSTMVIPSDCWILRNKPRMDSPVALSRLPVGSSASSRVGRFTSARASAARCCSPPESSLGRCVKPFSSPTRSTASPTRPARYSQPTSARRKGSSTFSSRVMRGRRLKD